MCENEKFKFKKEFTILKNKNHFSKIEEAFLAKSKMLTIIFQSHQIIIKKKFKYILR
jgi:hypothetical protein